MQVLFLKLIFSFRERNAHLLVSQNEKRRVPCGAFLYALQLIYRLKKKPLLKRILDGSRKFLTPLRLIKKWQHKNKKQGLLLPT